MPKTTTTKTTKRNRSAQDATLINIRALKAAVRALTVRVTSLERAHLKLARKSLVPWG